ncbi:IS66 family transposase, partial [Bradyrhizobium sp. CCBAU 65884]|uniref:IS66 family transposase n=1 Tax=Bradyrhizobium sp. CCBAU 65884 TaxID=722477 RepID=UPI002305325B
SRPASDRNGGRQLIGMPAGFTSESAHCWSHLRRRFVKLVRNSKSPIAEAAVRHIAQLYAIEAMVRGSSPDIRLAARKEHSLPMVAALKSWFEKQLSLISSGSTLAEDIRYALNQVCLHLQPATGSGAALRRWLRTSSRRYHRPFG